MNYFTESGLHSQIVDAVQEMGFEQPTPIQAKTIPHSLASRQDLIALAQTGTGKTAAFGLPAVHLTNTNNKHTQTLVLCPTRELCVQISKDLTQYSKYVKGLGIVPVYGGANIETQIKALKKQAQIVVGTPGRVRDLINRKELLLNNIERVILDEADEMLSMGFREELDAILSETPEKKQTSLYSATMSKEIINITKKYMDNPVELSSEGTNKGIKNVDHNYYLVHSKDKYEVLKRIADINPSIYGIVFCRTRRETKEIANKLMQDGYNAEALHGDLSQAQRDTVMEKFRLNHLQLLVATDVAARGLDVNDLTHIINYNLPDDAEGYIHRSGRTGRAGKGGISTAIIHTRETGKIKEIEKRAGITFSRKQVPSGEEICQKQLYTLIDKMEKVEVDEKQIEPFLAEIYKKLEWMSKEELIKHFVSLEFNRFLDYYKNAKDINVSERKIKDRKKAEPKKKSRKEQRKNGNDDNLKRMYINVGSRQNLNPPRLIGLINEALDSGNAEIGKIDIMKKFSFFDFEDKYKNQLIKALKGKNFEGTSLFLEVAKEKPKANFASTSNGKKREKSYGQSGSRKR
jgi:ATP-dependent RNA helicase DeaD